MYNSGGEGEGSCSFGLRPSQGAGCWLAGADFARSAYATTGCKYLRNSCPVRLFVVSKGKDSLKLQVTINGLESGQDYVLCRFTNLRHAAQWGHEKEGPAGFELFSAQDVTHALTQQVRRGEPSLYRCLRIVYDTGS